MSKLKYLEDTYLFEYPSVIKQIENDEKGIYIVLDSTIFYPQGGGQPTDYGTITGDSLEFDVTFVAFVEGEVRHYGKIVSGEMNVGDEIMQKVDAERRIRNAKNHSAGHLVGFIVESMHPVLVATKGYHFDEGPYIEFEGELSLEEKELLAVAIEAKASEAIDKSIPAVTFEVKFDELSKHSRRVPDYIPEGKPVRVMKIGDDAYPCGGTHISNTSELMQINVRKVKYKGNTLKVSYTVA